MKPEQAAAGADAAAEARFLVAEQDLKEFDKLKIGGRGKELERSFTVKRAGVKKVQDSYAEVFKYKQVEWSLAAAYRRGYVLERFGATINETPVPPEVKRLGSEAVVAYQDLLAQQTAALEDKAGELRRHPGRGEEEQGQQRVDQEAVEAPTATGPRTTSSGPQALHRSRRHRPDGLSHPGPQGGAAPRLRAPRPPRIRPPHPRSPEEAARDPPPHRLDTPRCPRGGLCHAPPPRPLLPGR